MMNSRKLAALHVFCFLKAVHVWIHTNDTIIYPRVKRQTFTWSLKRSKKKVILSFSVFLVLGFDVDPSVQLYLLEEIQKNSAYASPALKTLLNS